MAPSWVVERLREGEDTQGLIKNVNEKILKIGDKIKILNGPFYDHLAIFNGLDDNERVSVLLKVMGREVKAVVPHEFVSGFV